MGLEFCLALETFASSTLIQCLIYTVLVSHKFLVFDGLVARYSYFKELMIFSWQTV